MKIFYLAAISVMQLCTSSRGGSRQNSRHRSRGSTAAPGPSHDGYEDTSRFASLPEGEQLLLECLGDSTKDIYCSGEQNFDYGSCLEDFTEYAGEDDPQPIPHCDVNPLFTEQRLNGTNESASQASSMFSEEGTNCIKILEEKCRGMETTYFSRKVSSYDPSCRPLFASFPPLFTEVNGSSVSESYAGCSRDEKRNQNDNVEIHPPAYQESKRNENTMQTMKREENPQLNTQSYVESQASQENDETELTKRRKRRYVMAYGSDKKDTSKAGDDMTEENPSKRRKTAIEANQDDDVAQESRFETLSEKKKAFEDDVEKYRYEDWKKKQEIEAEEQGKKLDEIEILLRIMKELDLMRGTNHYHRKADLRKRAKCESPLETEEGQRQEKMGLDDTCVNSRSDASLYVVMSTYTQKCDRKEIKCSDFDKVDRSNMRIYFYTEIFFCIFEYRISVPDIRERGYKNQRECVKKYVFPIGSPARRKYIYLRDAMVGAGIKSVKVRVPVKHTLHLGNTDNGDTLEVSKWLVDVDKHIKALEDLIYFTGVDRVVYLINCDDLSRLPVDTNCAQQDKQNVLRHKELIRKRIDKYKEFGDWMEGQIKKAERGDEEDKVAYYIVIVQIPNTEDNTTDKEYKDLLVVHNIISIDSKVGVMREDTFCESYGVKFIHQKRERKSPHDEQHILLDH